MADVYDVLLSEIANWQPEPAPIQPPPAPRVDDPLDAIKAIETTVRARHVRKNPAPKPSPNEKYNLLTNYEEFQQPISENANGALSVPIQATVSLSAKFHGVSFHEQELIKVLEPTGNIAGLYCNFGEKTAPWYTPVVVVKKPKPKSTVGSGQHAHPHASRKPRKIQGSGKYMASQLEFYMCRRDDAAKTPFKIKVFRNGVVQFPGARLSLLPTIVAFLNEIAEALRQAGAGPVPEEIRMGSLYVRMENYKFFFTLTSNTQIIDLMMLKMILCIDKLKQDGGLYGGGDDGINLDAINLLMSDRKSVVSKSNFAASAPALLEYMSSIPRPPHPQIINIQYSYGDTKLTVVFKTPLPWKPLKTTHVNIFMGGYTDTGEFGAKINILGAVDREVTREIYEYFADIFERYESVIVMDRKNDEDEYEIVEGEEYSPPPYVESPPPTVKASDEELEDISAWLATLGPHFSIG